MGPLISPQAKQRVNSLIQSGVDEGAKVLLDGRNVKVKGYENGNFVGPTIISNVTVRATMPTRLYKKCPSAVLRVCPVFICLFMKNRLLYSSIRQKWLWIKVSTK